MFTIWTSTDELAAWLIEYSNLRNYAGVAIKMLPASDGSNPRDFHSVPTHIKKILYLDCPDSIIEYQSKPILSIEISREAGTGHNAFQRFGRLAASVEALVPAFYIYPEASIVPRNQSSVFTWDRINPAIFSALERLIRIYNLPVLLFYHPSKFKNSRTATQAEYNDNKGLISDIKYKSCPDSKQGDIPDFFNLFNIILKTAIDNKQTNGLVATPSFDRIRNLMLKRCLGTDPDTCSPLTSCEIVETDKILDYLRNVYCDSNYDFGDMLTHRNETIVYKLAANFRGDPYPGCLAAIDYLKTRTGYTYEDRDKNLVLLWGEMEIKSDGIKISRSSGKTQSINDFCDKIKKLYNQPNKVLLNKEYKKLKAKDIPRYYMQVRFGTTYTKSKEVRMYSYFADIILFPDGALWREG